MVDLAPINKQLEALRIIPVEEFCTLFRGRFQSVPAMQEALTQWEASGYDPITLERTVRGRLKMFTDLTHHRPPDELDPLIDLLEDSYQREAYLAVLYDLRTAKKLDIWCRCYFMEVHI